MYNRTHGQRRPPRIPENYGGNAFRPDAEMPPAPETPVCEEPDPDKDLSCQPESCDSCPQDRSDDCGPQKPRLPFAGGKLFPHGIGNEELLILGLILLISQSEAADEIIIFLIILLFC